MNQPSQQLTAEYNIILDADQPLRGKKLPNAIIATLGEECRLTNIAGKRVLLYEHGIKKIILLAKAISYLGNPHPVFKKRIQIPKSWLDFTRKVHTMGYEVRFLGVYHYDNFVVYADFFIDDYLQKNCNNSSAHVYVNDLYQGSTIGFFKKIDKNGNRVVTVARQNLRKYLQEGISQTDKLFELFARFNGNFTFGEWIMARDCIKEMHDKDWSQWRQVEWQAWFLEYQFSCFAEQEDVRPYMQYTGLAHKGHHENKYDFDVWFPQASFMGDFKASDLNQTVSPGNDKKTFIECIGRYHRFWYIVYEHETIRDKNCGYEATIWRNHYKKEIDNIPDHQFDELSYKNRMKNSVRFRRMYIVELNRINFRDVLVDFNQGHQPDGSARKVKFSIPKKAIDNFVIYRYNHPDIND